MAEQPIEKGAGSLADQLGLSIQREIIATTMWCHSMALSDGRKIVSFKEALYYADVMMRISRENPPGSLPEPEVQAK